MPHGGNSVAGNNASAGPSRWWRRDKSSNEVDDDDQDARESVSVRRAHFPVEVEMDDVKHSSSRRGYVRRALDAAGRLHAAVMAQASLSSMESGSRRFSSSTAATGHGVGRIGEHHSTNVKMKTPYAVDENSTWASVPGTLPGSLSEADLIISARRGDREYKWRSRAGGGGGGGGSKRRPGLPRRESGGAASDGDAPSGPINCIVVDTDLAAFIAEPEPEYDDCMTSRRDGSEDGNKLRARRRSHSRSLEDPDADVEKAPPPSIYPTHSDVGSHSRRRTLNRWLRHQWHDQIVTPVRNFADLSFDDEVKERAFQKEVSTGAQRLGTSVARSH